MYTGITKGLFKVTQVEKKPGLIIYAVELNEELIHGLNISDSVAIDGVCQSVVKIEHHQVTFNAMAETLSKTTLDDLFVGRKVSVERSARIGEEIGGHECAGHVFETATIIERISTENNLSLTIQCSNRCIQYIFEKGFIAIDGSSLTVGKINQEQNSFKIHLIPETLRLTNFGNKKVGDKVNIEIDHKTKVMVDTTQIFLSQLQIKSNQLEQRILELEKRMEININARY